MDFLKICILCIFCLNNFISAESVNYTNISEFSDSRAWIRLCKSKAGTKGNLVGAEDGTKCSSGFWFKDPIKIGCACGHGVWVFSKGWCDRSARVVTAFNGSCFSVDKDVRYIRNIGYANDAYMPYHFQTSVGFEYIQELPIGYDFSYMNSNYDQHLGAIFREKEIESLNSKRCLDRDDPANHTIAMKYYVDKMPYQQTDECFKIHGQNNTFTFDEGFGFDSYFVMKEKSKDSKISFIQSASWNGNGSKCATECVGNGLENTTAAGAGANSSMPEDYIDPMEDEYYPIDHYHNNMTLMNNTKVCNASLKTYSLTNKTIREITEQTKRMIMANLASSLKGIPTPKVEVDDYKYFQMARHILLKVCPNEEVPHSLVTGLLRMFRVAVKESLRFYPYSMRGDDNQTERITSSLQFCLDHALPFNFEYRNTSADNGNLTSDGNGTSNATSPLPKPYNSSICPTEFDKVSFSYTGGTINRTLYSDIPCELETDLKQLDLPTETAWKTVMLSHYYCARHFKLNVTDFSSFYDKMEQFFNRWIQHRWYYPGPSQKAYEFVFQMYDLKKFAINLDRCVSASRSFSNFRKWIKRPIYVKHCGGTTFQEIDDLKSSSESATKPKLDVITPKLTEFGNSAYCLPYWHSPSSNPGINYDPSKDGYVDGCIKYKPEEWEDDMTPDINAGWTNTL